MFNLLCPIRTGVSAADAAVFTAHEAAVAAALSAGYGPGAARLGTADAAFVSLLAAAQGASGPGLGPPERGPRVGWRQPGVRLAAAVAVALAYRKVEDDLKDEPTRRRALAERWLRGKQDRARRIVASLGFDLQETDAAFDDQAGIEAAGAAPLEAMAKATGRGMAALFGYTARLAGVERNVGPLSDIGAAVGELIYVVDAAHDLGHDARFGLANPLITSRPGRVPREADFPGARRLAQGFARSRLEAIARRLPAVAFTGHRSLVTHILAEALPLRAAAWGWDGEGAGLQPSVRGVRILRCARAGVRV